MNAPTPSDLERRLRLTRVALLLASVIIILLMLMVASGDDGPAAIPLPIRNSATPADIASAPHTPAAGSHTPAAGPTQPPPTRHSFFPVLLLESVFPTPTDTPLPPPTDTPGPTLIPPPPEPGWPEPLPGQTASKLGLHVIRMEDSRIMEYVRRVKPRVMKAVDDVGWLTEVKDASPGTVVIGRFEGQNESWPEQLDPAAAAKHYVAERLERYRLNTGVDYWEGWNEFVPVTEARWRWYTQFEAARACEMQAQGLRAAVGGFTLGTPEYKDMAIFVPALEAAYRCGGIFTVHEAVSARFGCGVGVNDPAVLIPGAPMFKDVTLGYIMLRYRFWYEGYLKPRGMGDLPLVISELAVAPDVTCPGPHGAGAGWKEYADWWVKQGVGPDGPRAFVNLLAWYDSELRKDPYVIGTTIFTAGAISRELGWYAFDLHDVIIPLAAYAATQR